MDQSSKDHGKHDQAEKPVVAHADKRRETPSPPPPVDPVETIIKDPPGGDS
jgi:hypothetical protein